MDEFGSVCSDRITAVGSGTATITVRTANGKTDTCQVTVTDSAAEIIEVTSVSLNKSALTLEIGDSETLIATVSPSNATDKSVTWTSSAQSVATDSCKRENNGSRQRNGYDYRNIP